MKTTLMAEVPMLPFLLSFSGALLLALILTHRVRGWANHRGLVDLPDGGRRVHAQPTPRVGGIAVFAAVAIVIGLGIAFGASPLSLPAEQRTSLFALLAGGAAVFVLGLWDDIRPLRASTKFSIEALIAVAVFIGGIRIGGFGIPGGETLIFPMLLSLGLTIFWIVGITNAFNLIDGSDGVAAGAALFASASLGVVSLLGGNELGALIALALTGATLGFLFFNFPPASIFLGDSGSLFLGFTLAALGAITMQKAPTAVAIAIPVVSFGLPILDTSLAMVRRFLRRDPIFTADRGHIHHRLRDLGHTPRAVALLLYAACGTFALISLVLIQPRGTLPAIVLIVTGAVVGLVIQKLKIPELLEVQRVVSRGLQQRSVIAHNLRVREAVGLLCVANTPKEVTHALEFAFTRGEFERAELWLERGLNGGEPRGSTVRRPAWSWMLTEAAAVDRLWEIRMPFHDEDGKAMGRLSLWRGVGSEYLLTDIQLIAKHLHPALQLALLRVHARNAAVAATQPAPLPVEAIKILMEPEAARPIEKRAHILSADGTAL